MMIERVVVTGASNGIGAACVGAFRDLGSEVIGVDKEATSDADDHLALDLSIPDCGDLLLDHLRGRPVDVLVNNAAIGFALEATAADASLFDLVMAVNLRAPFLLATALQPTLAKREGSVVNVASVHALATSSRVSIYAASKGGLVSLTRALALEWAPAIRVNCVLPGAVDTAALLDGLSRAKASLEEFALKQPLQRVGLPDQIAETVVFLTRNQFITGASFVVDGGATARLSTE